MEKNIVEFHTGGYGIALINKGEIPKIVHFEDCTLYDFELHKWVSLDTGESDWGKLVPKSCKCNTLEYAEKCILELDGEILVYQKFPF
jgi:hypothetical protein